MHELMKGRSKKVIITFDKSATKFICEALNVSYDKNIIGFIRKDNKTIVVKDWLELFEVEEIS